MRRINSDSVRQMCIDYGFYTCGCNEDYEHLLYSLCSSGDSRSRTVSDSDLEEIARDVVSHSSRDVFEKMLPNTLYVFCVRTVMELLADRCINFVVND